jgi:hypothetical protein
LNACVLSRSYLNDFSKNLNMFKFFSKFAKFGFAKGLAKGKLGGSLLTVDNVKILYVNKQEKWLKYKNMHMSRV